MTDDDAQGRPRLRRARRWLVGFAAVVAVTGVVATEVLDASTREPSVDPGRVAERIEPVPPSPSCPPPKEATSEAIAQARPGDGEFKAEAVSSLCSVSEGR